MWYWNIAGLLRKAWWNFPKAVLFSQRWFAKVSNVAITTNVATTTNVTTTTNVAISSNTNFAKKLPQMSKLLENCDDCPFYSAFVREYNLVKIWSNRLVNLRNLMFYSKKAILIVFSQKQSARQIIETDIVSLMKPVLISVRY